MATVLKAPDLSIGRTGVDEMVARIEQVAPQLQANALAEEKAGRLSQETIRALDEIGVYRISTPVEYGGLAYDTEEQRRVYAAVGAIAGSTGWVTWVNTVHCRWIGMFAKQAQDEVFGRAWTGPLISGVVPANGVGLSTARRVEGGYMLSGRWPFCSGCRHTAWSILGSRAERPDGQFDVLLPIVSTADVEILDDWAVSGMRATGSNTVQLKEELFVPEHRTIFLGDAVAGRWRSAPPAGTLFRTNFLDYTTILSGSTPLGMAKGALGYYRDRMAKRGITGTDYEVQADAAVTHLQLVEATARIDAADRLLSEDCRELDRRSAAGIASDDLFQAKLKFDAALAVRNCAEAIEILHRGSGASTIHEANPMQRYARDARVATVHAHFNYETCAENYGRALASKPLFGKAAVQAASTGA